MPAVRDLTGMRFGLLVAIRHVGKNKSGNYTWLCQCDCGNSKVSVSRDLVHGDVRSCGSCVNLMIKHGKTNSRAYSIWQHIIQRCTNPNCDSYDRYGGRGITVCDKWLSFTGFFEDMGDPPDNECQIDRIDNDKGYCGENCRWTTRSINQRNRRNTKFYSFNGMRLTVPEIAELSGMPYGILRRRLAYGWDLARATTQAVGIPLGRKHEK